VAGITVTREDLQYLGGVEIGERQFETLDRHVRRAIAAAFKGDVDLALGTMSTTLSAVYTSACLRILTNPTGARSISLGSASTTTGGTDEALADPLALTPRERADVASLNPRRRRPSYVQFTDPLWPAMLRPIRHEADR
jgi:hypothetical protein